MTTLAQMIERDPTLLERLEREGRYRKYPANMSGLSEQERLTGFWKARRPEAESADERERKAA